MTDIDPFAPAGGSSAPGRGDDLPQVRSYEVIGGGHHPPVLDLPADSDVLPGSPARRRVGRPLVAATLAVLLVLLGAGAAYGVVFLHRPDVQLARALHSTTTASDGDLRVTVRTDAATLTALGADPGTAHDVANALGTSSVRYAWGTGTQQTVLTYSGAQILDLITTNTHLTLQTDLAGSGQPALQAAAAQLTSIAAGLGADGQPLRDLADGHPVGLDIGPGSPFRKLADKATSGTGSVAKAESFTPEQISALADALQTSLQVHTVVTAAGSDEFGDHFHAVVDVAKVAADMAPPLAALVPAASSISSSDLTSMAGTLVDVDLWVRDGALSKVEIPLGALLARSASPKVTGTLSLTLVAVVGTTGVTPATDPVREVDGALLSRLMGAGA